MDSIPNDEPTGPSSGGGTEPPDDEAVQTWDGRWFIGDRELPGVVTDYGSRVYRRVGRRLIRLPWKEDDWRSGRLVPDPRVLLGRATPGGRKPLEESPSSPARYLADQARELLATEPWLTIKEVASRLLVNFDELLPEEEGKAERAAERRLRRYLERFPESSD